MLLSRFAPLAFLVGLVTLAGCGGGPNLAEVEGTVTVGGKPVSGIRVEFWPEGSGPRSLGTTDGQGKYTLTSDDGKRKGASVGSHKVVLRDVGILGDKFLGRAGEDVDMTKGKKPRISNQYGEATKTTLTKEVTAGKKNVIDIEATP
jgi:hypothetical protein